MIDFFYFLYYTRSFWSILILLIGIMLLIVWKVKKKGKALLTIGIIFLVVPVITLLSGCYHAYVAPKETKINMSTVELKRFAEYVIRDGNFLHHEKLLPNNEKYEDDENEYHYQQIRYKRNCTLNTFLYTYNNSTEAKVAFFEKLKATSFDSVSDSQYEILIEEDNYTICASPVKNTSTFFDLEAGEFKSKELRIDILYGNYNICFIEHTSNYNPILYKLAKEEKMFDSEYTLKVRN